jgi:hypothetical protein
MSFSRLSMPVPPVKGAQSQYSFFDFFSFLMHCSNLTFGTGGKDKDGVAVAGWGYYEVTCSHIYLEIPTTNGV